MRKRNHKWLTGFNIFTDGFAVILAGLVSLAVRFGFDWSTIDYKWYLLTFVFVAMIDLFTLYFNNYYDYGYRSLTVEIPAMVKAFMYSFMLFFIVSFFTRFVSFSRLFIVLFIAFTLLFQIIGKIIFHYTQKYLYKKGYGVRRVLLVGCNTRGQEIASYLSDHPEYGYRVMGCLLPDSYNNTSTIRQLGYIGKFEKVVNENNISTVIISLDDRVQMEKIVNFCEANYLKVFIIPDILDLTAATLEAGQINDVPLLTISESMLSPLQLKLKRVFDIVSALFALIIISPLLITISILIKTTSKGPIFYKQKRLAHGKEVMYIYKFRSMVSNADEVLQELLNNDTNLKDEYNRDFKLKNDPRVTKIGKFLRKTSLDELPQLFNILKGDMSWVGPRPIVQDEINRYGEYARIILRVPPGLTGYWQTNGRSDLDYEERIKLDIYYINNWSFLLDIIIILRTIPCIFSRKGAY